MISVICSLNGVLNEFDPYAVYFNCRIVYSGNYFCCMGYLFEAGHTWNTSLGYYAYFYGMLIFMVWFCLGLSHFVNAATLMEEQTVTLTMPARTTLIAVCDGTEQAQARCEAHGECCYTIEPDGVTDDQEDEGEIVYE